MDPILDKARAAQNVLEKLANFIPGFRGYREKELRRDTDRLQREYLSKRLGENRKTLDQVANTATRSKNLDLINDVETARKKLERVTSRLVFSDKGYSAFFEAVKVDDNMLERVYQYDMSLLQGIDGVSTAAQAAATDADPRTALREMAARIDALDKALSEREAILAGVK